MSFKPEEMVFHREEYQAKMATLRPKDYAPLTKKEVTGRVDLRLRRENPYTKDGKALVSFVVTGDDLKQELLNAVNQTPSELCGRQSSQR
ncbi:hypothetical protein ACFLZM_08495 [Thermodesulfobacteriota bacterium]